MSRNPKNGGRPNQKTRNIHELLSTLSESELLALNQCIVERLRTLQQQRAQQNMTQFRLSDVVRFIDNDEKEVTGIIIRLNKKTVSVHSKTAGRWTISPHFLTLIKRQTINEEASLVVDIPATLNKMTH